MRKEGRLVLLLRRRGPARLPRVAPADVKEFLPANTRLEYRYDRLCVAAILREATVGFYS